MDHETFIAIDKAVKTTLRRMGLGGDHDAYQDGWEHALRMLRRYRPIRGNQEALFVNYLNMGLGLKIARELRHRTRPLCYYKKDVEIRAVDVEKASGKSHDPTDVILTCIDLRRKLAKLDESYAGMVYDCLCGDSVAEVARKNSIPRSRFRRVIAGMSSDDAIPQEERCCHLH